MYFIVVLILIILIVYYSVTYLHMYVRILIDMHICTYVRIAIFNSNP